MVTFSPKYLNNYHYVNLIWVNVHHPQGLRMMDIHSDLSSNADMNRYEKKQCQKSELYF
jgi:hypothetical protein